MVQEQFSDPVSICTVLARVHMTLRFRREMKDVEEQVIAMGDPAKALEHRRRQEVITKEIEPLIGKQACRGKDRPRPAGDPTPDPNPPVDNSVTERRRKRTLRRAKKAGIGFNQGPQRGKKGSSMSMSTEDVVRQGASPNDANSPSLAENLWSRMTSLPSFAAGYFQSPIGGRDRDGGGDAGIGPIHGGGGGRPVIGLGLGR